MNMLMGIYLGDIEENICGLADSIVNYAIDIAKTMLTYNPQKFAEESGVWTTITNINNKIIPIASALLALFFFIGFCENCIDVKEELNFELCLKLFIRIGIAEYFVVNSIDIVLSLFSFTTNLAGLSTNEIVRYDFVTDVTPYISDCSNAERLGLLLLIPILFIIAIGTAAVIIITVLIRFFKIWIAVPYGTLAFSTISSGSHWLNGTVSAFIKYLLSVLLEAFSMGIGLSIGLKFAIKGSANSIFKIVEFNSEGYGNFQTVLLNITYSAISLMIIMMLLRTSQKIAGKVLALDR
ncbi:MAG: hypothetical protein K2M78_08090 [Lachnospiraceae bacterium]|nr:hypothetical protein [Lachnospiraceae bacterium]